MPTWDLEEASPAHRPTGRICFIPRPMATNLKTFSLKETTGETKELEHTSRISVQFLQGATHIFRGQHPRGKLRLRRLEDGECQETASETESFFPAVLYNDYIVPNSIENDTDFLTYDYVEVLLKAVNIDQGYALG